MKEQPIFTNPKDLNNDYSHLLQGQPHLQYYKSRGYDDFHKAFLAVDGKACPPYPEQGVPR